MPIGIRERGAALRICGSHGVSAALAQTAHPLDIDAAASAILNSLAMLGVMLPIVAAPLPVGLAAGTLAAAARTAWLEGRGVARNLSLAGARIGPGDDRRCGLWLLNGDAV